VGDLIGEVTPNVIVDTCHVFGGVRRIPNVLSKEHGGSWFWIFGQDVNMNEILPDEFIPVARALASPIPPDVPDWDSNIIPFTKKPENVKLIIDKVTEAGLEMSDDILDAIEKEYEGSAAFLYDYGDICEGLHKLTEEKLPELLDRAVEKIIRYTKEYNDPYYDPIMKGLKDILMSDKEWKALEQEIKQNDERRVSGLFACSMQTNAD
jgi:hypothetical protein